MLEMEMLGGGGLKRPRPSLGCSTVEIAEEEEERKENKKKYCSLKLEA
jgi:hypothetical protein